MDSGYLWCKGEPLRRRAGVERAKELLRIAREAGVNCFDHAEAYGTLQGRQSGSLNSAVRINRGRPHPLAAFGPGYNNKNFLGGSGVNERGLSRKHIMEGMDSSLERLGLDYVDMVFCHRPDPHTPTATVVRAMTDIVRSGASTSWGTSEWSAQQITEAFWIARTEAGAAVLRTTTI